MTIQIIVTDNEMNAGFLSRVFQLPMGHLTLTQTIPSYATDPAGWAATVAGITDKVPIGLLFTGVKYLKLFCGMAQGFNEAHV